MPVRRIEGIDLVTEGALTRLLGSEKVTFFVGRALNPAYQNRNLPRELGLKSHFANEIKLNLKKLGKIVCVEVF